MTLKSNNQIFDEYFRGAMDAAGNKPGDKVTLNSGAKVTLVRRADRNNQERWECSNGGFWYPSDGGKTD